MKLNNNNLEGPVSEGPVSEDPVSEDPVSETPTSETPVSETFTSENPIATSSSSETPVIELKHLTVGYGKRIALLDISCRIFSGQVVGLMGPNGAGKSTLLKSILGLLPSSEDKDMGQIYIHGQPLSKGRHEISYVPQRKEVDLHYPITVEEMVLMGRYHLIPWWKEPSLKDKKAVTESLKILDLENYKQARIDTLSGGLLQRSFVARAFAQNADILLMDEPFVGVDLPTEKNIIETIQLAKKSGKTLLIVHHDFNNIAEIFDDIILINQRIYSFASSQATLNNSKLIKEVYSS